MSEEIIEIPKKWYLTLFKDHYFETFKEMYNRGHTMERTFYDLEAMREEAGIPPAYLTFDSFRKAFYKWVKSKCQNSNDITEERYILRKTR